MTERWIDRQITICKFDTVRGYIKSEIEMNWPNCCFQVDYVHFLYRLLIRTGVIVAQSTWSSVYAVERVWTNEKKISSKQNQFIPFHLLHRHWNIEAEEGKNKQFFPIGVPLTPQHGSSMSDVCKRSTAYKTSCKVKTWNWIFHLFQVRGRLRQKKSS